MSLQVELVTITSWLVFQSSLVDLHCTGAFGASGAFPSVVLLVHNGSAIWLSFLFSENFSDSGRSNDGIGSARLLGEECS